MTSPQTTEHDATQTAALTATYDAAPYPCEALPQTHPDVMAVAATLHGMTPAPIDACRVLEIGCGDGTNLLPLAMLFPRSRIVGIDLSPRQIAQGQAIQSELGLENLELRMADLMKLDDDLGVFDYIICHGVYSWVPERVQERILALCGQHLSPQGVAYISYNTYPGSHKHQALREMMLYHTAELRDPIEASKQALALVDFLLRNQTDKSGTYTTLLREEFERLRRMPLSYISHDHLEPDNRPCYFHQFISRASAHGLQFLAEADKSGSELLPGPVQQALSELPDAIRREQYIDFARNTSFRSTLLCRANVTLQPGVAEQKTHAMQVRGTAQPNQPMDDACAPGVVEFTTRYGTAAVEHQVFKAMTMALLEARPATLSLSQLAARIGELLHAPITEEQLAEMVCYAQRTGFVTLHMRGRPVAASAGERPLVMPLARLQARRQLAVVNVWHQRVNISELERRMLPLLDGSRDEQALVAELVMAFDEGLRHTKDDANLDGKTLRDRAPQILAQILSNLHENGLLAA